METSFSYVLIVKDGRVLPKYEHQKSVSLSLTQDTYVACLSILGKDHLHSFHFRTSELQDIKINRFGCSKYCPDRFHFGRSQDIRINDRATLLDLFFRVPNQQDAVQWITREVRQLVAGPPASTPRALDPITREVRQLVGESVQGTIPHLPASR